ncbi:hypothetical protein AD006_28775 (plasmid) [Pseudonocardia sp. EC080610-09]|nr:hypothetical protein AD006_28775 [Pseudonocardia sp. EC080610-09]ALL85280.1 hypothetical protein AD017_29165 [Pseudonocardia sp. EC080619-01]
MLVVGNSVAGVRTAQALRRGGHAGPIRILGREPHPPYDKPPLSKDTLVSGELVPLVDPAELAELDIAVDLNRPALALDPARRVVTTGDGDELGYDQLVIATGADARPLPGTESVPGVFTVRTADDATRLRAALTTARHVVVVGAGFIGAEVAGSARSLGVEVTVLEALDHPMEPVVGAEVGDRLGGLHVTHGTQLLTGARVERVERDRRLRVHLADDRVVSGDVIVVGIGAVPATGWLRSSGLPLVDGVLCGPDLRVRGHERIWAAGDVARRPHPTLGPDVRIEHWTNAGEHAELVAAGILGRTPRPAQPPYVWSDQYGHRIQIVGSPRAGRLARLRGGVGEHPDGPLVAVYGDTDDRVVGGVVVDAPKEFVALRRAVTARTPVADLMVGAGAGRS